MNSATVAGPNDEASVLETFTEYVKARSHRTTRA